MSDQTNNSSQKLEQIRFQTGKESPRGVPILLKETISPSRRSTPGPENSANSTTTTETILGSNNDIEQISYIDVRRDHSQAPNSHHNTGHSIRKESTHYSVPSYRCILIETILATICCICFGWFTIIRLRQSDSGKKKFYLKQAHWGSLLFIANGIIFWILVASVILLMYLF